MIPRYQHNCNRCVFLGQFNGSDLYYCYDLSIPTIIVRINNEPTHYVRGFMNQNPQHYQNYYELFEEAHRRILYFNSSTLIQYGSVVYALSTLPYQP